MNTSFSPLARSGATSWRRAWTGPRRRIATLLITLVAAATLAHHLLPEHAAMPGMGHGDSSMPVAAPCLGVVESGLLLAPVGGVILLARQRSRRRAVERAPRGARQLGPAPPVPPPQSGPPLFLRIAVLRY